MSEILKYISKKHIYQKEFSNVYPVWYQTYSLHYSRDTLYHWIYSTKPIVHHIPYYFQYNLPYAFFYVVLNRGRLHSNHWLIINKILGEAMQDLAEFQTISNFVAKISSIFGYIIYIYIHVISPFWVARNPPIFQAVEKPRSWRTQVWFAHLGPLFSSRRKTDASDASCRPGQVKSGWEKPLEMTYKS